MIIPGVGVARTDRLSIMWATFSKGATIVWSITLSKSMVAETSTVTRNLSRSARGGFMAWVTLLSNEANQPQDNVI